MSEPEQKVNERTYDLERCAGQLRMLGAIVFRRRTPGAFGVDSGIGMTAEQISKLFRDFAQADGSTTRKYAAAQAWGCRSAAVSALQTIWLSPSTANVLPIP